MAKQRPKREGIMLCYPTDEGRVLRLGDLILGQPKIKGERAHVEWFAGEPVLISSYGNEFKFLEHIKFELIKMRNDLGEIPFDGELYVHGWSQEQISGILRSTVNKHPDTAELEYHIFDIKSDDDAIQRMSFLSVLRHKHYIDGVDQMLKLVPTVGLNRDNWMTFANKFVELGYEGIVLRQAFAPWVPKRTVNMLKFKPTEEDEYMIISVNEAIDKDGKPKDMVGSFTVKAKDVDETFKVGAGKMKHSRRVELWKLKSILIGKMLIVKHELITTNKGIPICAVAVEVKL